MTRPPARHARRVPTASDGRARHPAHDAVDDEGTRTAGRAAPSASRPYATEAYVAAPSRLRRAVRAPGVLSAALGAVAVVLRVAAIALCVLVAANAVASGLARLQVVDATTAVTSALPAALSGTLTLPTVLGGVFRGDIAIAALALFVADWLCLRASAMMGDR